MPVLSNARHERFARALADGAAMDEALLIAGYKAGSGIAARLSTRADVVRRMGELRGEAPEAPPPQPSPDRTRLLPSSAAREVEVGNIRLRRGRGGVALPAVRAISEPDIHGSAPAQSWIPGTSPGMTAHGGSTPDDRTGGDAGCGGPDAAGPPAPPTRQWVLARLVDNVERALQLGEGREGEAARGKYDGSVANRALELLGKELGMFTERTDNRQAPHDISDQPLSPEEWAKRHIVDP